MIANIEKQPRRLPRLPRFPGLSSIAKLVQASPEKRLLGIVRDHYKFNFKGNTYIPGDLVVKFIPDFDQETMVCILSNHITVDLFRKIPSRRHICTTHIPRILTSELRVHDSRTHTDIKN